MTEHIAFHCCKAAKAAGMLRGYTEPADIGDKASRRDSALPAIPIEAAPINIETAWHEAGHAVVGTHEGFELEEVRIIHPCASLWAPWGERSFSVGQVVREALAGDIAERWRDRLVHRASDDDLMFFVRAVRANTGGGCDGCYAFRHIVAVRPDWNDCGILQLFRTIEAEAIEIVTSRPVTAAIRAVAAQLMLTPTMSGDDVRAIIQKFF